MRKEITRRNFLKLAGAAGVVTAGAEIPKPAEAREDERESVELVALEMTHVASWGSYDSSFLIGVEENNLGERVEEHEYPAGEWQLRNPSSTWAYSINGEEVISVKRGRTETIFTEQGDRVKLFLENGFIESYVEVNGVPIEGVLDLEEIEGGTRLIYNDYEQVTYGVDGDEYELRVGLVEGSRTNFGEDEIDWQRGRTSVTINLPSLDEVLENPDEAMTVVVEVTKRD